MKRIILLSLLILPINMQPTILFGLKSYELRDVEYEVTSVDNTNHIIWSATVINNTVSHVEGIGVAVEIFDSSGEKILTHSFDRFNLKRFGSKKIKCEIVTDKKDIDKVIGEIWSIKWQPSGEWEDSKPVVKKEREPSSSQKTNKNTERYKDKANEAHRRFQSLKRKQEIKAALYE